MSHYAVMIDIETLATSVDAVVCTVGAVRVNLETLEVELPGRKWSLDWIDQQRLGRKIEASTVAWWLSQSKEAIDGILADPTHPSTVTILQEVVQFVGDDGVWGNGADFDCAILKHLFDTYHLKGWSFRQHRCYRTLAALLGDRVAWPDKDIGVHHDALDDAIFQAHMLCKFLKEVGASAPVPSNVSEVIASLDQPKEAMSDAELDQYCPSA
jgi:3'-5' exoribonuclease-like protein